MKRLFFVVALILSFSSSADAYLTCDQCSSDAQGRGCFSGCNYGFRWQSGYTSSSACESAYPGSWYKSGGNCMSWWDGTCCVFIGCVYAEIPGPYYYWYPVYEPCNGNDKVPPPIITGCFFQCPVFKEQVRIGDTCTCQCAKYLPIVYPSASFDIDPDTCVPTCKTACTECGKYHPEASCSCVTDPNVCCLECPSGFTLNSETCVCWKAGGLGGEGYGVGAQPHGGYKEGYKGWVRGGYEIR